MFRLPNCNHAEMPCHFWSLRDSGLGSTVPGGTHIVKGIIAQRNSSISTAREYFCPRVNYFLFLCPGVKLAEIRITSFMKSHSNIARVFKQNKSNFYFIIKIFTYYLL